LNFPLDSLDINQLSLGLDSTVLLTGDYEAAYKVVNHRYDEIITCNNDKLLVLSGVLMGALGDENSIPLLEKAERISSNPYVNFMSMHRKNALNVKKFYLNSIAFDEMNELDHRIDSHIQYENVPHSEKLILKASVANLRALNYLKIRNEEMAYLEILKAFNLSKSGITSGLTRREGLRYHAQILANLAQMLVLNKNYSQAINILEESIEFCNKYEPDSLSESLSLLAYAHYLARNFENAIRFAGPAIEKIIAEGSISRLEVITNILIASHWQLGNRGAAEYILREFEQDPFHLGVE
jgi:tetratricopeptide (TPR) repeat protein